MDTLLLIGLSWITFNVAIGGAVAVLLLARAVRRKKRLRDSGVAGLMVAHRQAEKPPFEYNVVTLRRPSPESSSSISICFRPLSHRCAATPSMMRRL